ncbi:MAG: transcriptional regulator [Clostridiales bacterium]|nr:transcriptional regulator [Clostridiales bacterium]
MDQIRIGNFIRELRREKELTQEQLAERFSVARRTVSRWETGSNLPDMDILIEMSDFFRVDLRELLDGERKKEEMNEEMKDTVLKAAEYVNDGKKRMSRIVMVYFIAGIAAMIIHLIAAFMDLPGTFWSGFLEGSTIGLATAAMVMGILYVTGVMEKVNAFKRRLTGRDKADRQ